MKSRKEIKEVANMLQKMNYWQNSIIPFECNYDTTIVLLSMESSQNYIS